MSVFCQCQCGYVAMNMVRRKHARAHTRHRHSTVQAAAPHAPSHDHGSGLWDHCRMLLAWQLGAQAVCGENERPACSTFCAISMAFARLGSVRRLEIRFGAAHNVQIRDCIVHFVRLRKLWKACHILP